MKVLHISGSPRKDGISTGLAQLFLARIGQQGATIDSFELNRMQYQGCQGCYACKTGSERCVLNDELAPVLDELFRTDLVVISTPVYFSDVSGQLKCFIDRLFSLAKPDYLTNSEPSRLPKGKKLVFIQSQEGDKSLHRDIFEKYGGFFNLAGFQPSLMIRACGVTSPREIHADQDLLNHVEETARQILAV
ncbi:MAG: flavodoxin family protein [Desulfobacteraceae bacterium]|nr:flavodoxin family protein [Desulfobacteraceae bacterium]